jgi:hypothetical protein
LRSTAGSVRSDLPPDIRAADLARLRTAGPSMLLTITAAVVLLLVAACVAPHRGLT